MVYQQHYESMLQCLHCGKQMYALKDTINSIYVCSYCGFSTESKPLSRNQMKKNSTSSENPVCLKKIFSKRFMKKYTDFDSFSEFTKQCDLINESLEDLTRETFKNIHKRKMNRFVRRYTCFSSWDQMFQKAIESYLYSCSIFVFFYGL